MKRITTLGSVLIISLMIAACGPSPEEIAQQTEVAMTAEALTWTPTPPPTATPIVYEITIEAIDEEGKPIPNAKIIGKETLLADENGIWQGSTMESNFNVSVWAQGFMTHEISTTLEPGENTFPVILTLDPNGLQLANLEKEGYQLIFVEDFQDGIIDCQMDGNGGLSIDEATEGNQTLLVDLRNLDSSFKCAFGPVDIQNAIIEVDFLYPEIRYNDFSDDSEYHWQGYIIYFRDGFDIEGYPIRVPWGPTIQVLDAREDDWKFPVTARQSIDENRWYKFSTNWQDDKVEVRMNDSVRFNYLSAPETVNSEPAGIAAFGQALIQFDNLKMWIPIE